MLSSLKKNLKKLFFVLFGFIVMFVCAIEVNFLFLFGFTPSLIDIQKPNMRVASELYSSDGKLLARFYRENRSPVSFDKIPKSVINALVATEDARFYEHFGIDVISTLGSLHSTATGEKRGGSTITQQLAKNLYRTRADKHQGLVKYIPVVRTAVFKLKEWLTAIKLEINYSKEEILTHYLNTVPFGNNAFGIKMAARLYFNKEVSRLNIEEAATLIGMLKATSTYNPIKNPNAALERRNVVLKQMEKYGYLSSDKCQRIKNKPLLLKVGTIEDNKESSNYLRDAVAKWLDDWCEENDHDLYEDGLKIYTSIDSRLQLLAEEAVNDHMKALQRRLYNSWGTENPWRDGSGNEIVDFPIRTAQKGAYYQTLQKKYHNNQDSILFYLNIPKRMKVFSWQGQNGEKDTTFSTLDSIKYYAKILNVGMLTIDPFSGQIKVWVGGVNHKYFKYDHVKQSKRQPGSTFKPFAYLAALEGGMSPCDKFIDKPIKIEYEENGAKKIWEPKNATYSFSGREMSLRWAMAKSCNSITAQITQLVGWNKVVECAKRCGIESELKSVPSISLGSSEVSLFELVKAYTSFPNKGERIDPILVTRIEDGKGHTIKRFKPKSTRALTEEIAWIMMYMFKGGMEEPEGTSQALWEWDLWKKGNEIGGKTGTSSNYVDGWYIGFTKDLVTGVWVGTDERNVHFKNSQTGEASKTALPIFGKFMERVYKHPELGYTEGRFPKPSIKIERNYYCPTPRPKVITKDSTSVSEDVLIEDEPTSTADTIKKATQTSPKKESKSEPSKH